MLYVQLEVNWINNPKIARAGMDGAGLHATCLCMAKGLETDGWIDTFLLHRLGASDDLIDRLVGLRLLEQDGDRVRPHGWLERNPSSEEIRRKKSDSARAANHARWHEGPLSACQKCRSSEPDPVGQQTDSSGSLEVEAQSESDPEAAAEPDPPLTSSDRQARIDAACLALATSRADARNDVGPRWIPAVAHGLAKDWHQALHAWLVAHPGASTEDLIGIIEGCAKADKFEPVNTSAFLQPIADVIADRPPVDRDLNCNEVRKLRAVGSHPQGMR